MHSSVQCPSYIPSQKDFRRWESLKKNIRRCCYSVIVYNHDKCIYKNIILNSSFKICITIAKQAAEFNAENILNSFNGNVEVEMRIDRTSRMPAFCVFHNGRMIFSYKVCRDSFSNKGL